MLAISTKVSGEGYCALDGGLAPKLTIGIYVRPDTSERFEVPRMHNSILTGRLVVCAHDDVLYANIVTF